MKKLNGTQWADMVSAGAANLHAHMEEVNELNVFPIPDGDTGENMMLTMQGGVKAAKNVTNDLSKTAAQISDGMLLGARGNSGVILSQFFAGIAQGFDRCREADLTTIEKAIESGVGCAFESVMTPTEGTILTVMREAGKYAEKQNCESVEEYFRVFLEEARRSLAHTPELLPILKEAGVVDSGGAGLVYIAEGMYAFLTGKHLGEDAALSVNSGSTVDPTLFGADDVMKFGYCTELLLRLQTSKVDPDSFDTDTISAFLNEIGDSVVLVRNGTAVKLHVHTMTPHKVLEYCQQFGEFLTVKIENMMLQHNGNVRSEEEKKEAVPTMALTPRRPFAVVTVATGEGIRRAFSEMGADEVIYGGQTMNPSAQDFLDSFARVNADVIFVLPNNGNVLLAARQAALMYRESDVRVIPTHSIGDGYAVLSMLDFDSGDASVIEQAMNAAMEGVITAEITHSVRDTEMNGVSVKKGDYIAIAEKKILSSGENREEVTIRAAEALDLEEHAILMLIRGNGVTEEDAQPIIDCIQKNYPLTELCVTDGGQEIYDYILVAE